MKKLFRWPMARHDDRRTMPLGALGAVEWPINSSHLRLPCFFPRWRMTRQLLIATCLLIAASGLVGCASQTTAAEDRTARESEVVQEAPLGSRIKMRTKIAPGE